MNNNSQLTHINSSNTQTVIVSEFTGYLPEPSGNIITPNTALSPSFPGNPQFLGQPINDPNHFLARRLDQLATSNNTQEFNNIDRLRENIQNSSNLIEEIQPTIISVLRTVDENVIFENLVNISIPSNNASAIASHLVHFNNHLRESVLNLRSNERLFNNFLISIPNNNSANTTEPLFHFLTNIPSDVLLEFMNLMHHNPVIFLLIARCMWPLAALLTRRVNFRSINIRMFIQGLHNLVIRARRARDGFFLEISNNSWRSNIQVRLNQFYSTNANIARELNLRLRRNSWLRTRAISVAGISVLSSILVYAGSNRQIRSLVTTILTQISTTVSTAVIATPPTPPKKEETKELFSILTDLLKWFF